MEPTQADLLAHYTDSLTKRRELLADIEHGWKLEREALKLTCLLAVTEGHLSISKVADLAGINRKTLTIWLQIENAEKKGLYEGRNL